MFRLIKRLMFTTYFLVMISILLSTTRTRSAQVIEMYAEFLPICVSGSIRDERIRQVVPAHPMSQISRPDISVEKLNIRISGTDVIMCRNTTSYLSIYSLCSTRRNPCTLRGRRQDDHCIFNIHTSFVFIKNL